MRWAEHVVCKLEENLHTTFISENMEVKVHAEDLRIVFKIILKWVLGKLGGNMWTGFIWLRIGVSGWLF